MKENEDDISYECTNVRPARPVSYRERGRLRLSVEPDYQEGFQYKGFHALPGSKETAGTRFPDGVRPILSRKKPEILPDYRSRQTTLSDVIRKLESIPGRNRSDCKNRRDKS